MNHSEYSARINRPSPDQIRTLVRLRAALLIVVTLTFGIVAPPVLLLLLAVPALLRRYRARLLRGPGIGSRIASESVAIYRAQPWW